MPARYLALAWILLMSACAPPSEPPTSRAQAKPAAAEVSSSAQTKPSAADATSSAQTKPAAAGAASPSQPASAVACESAPAAAPDPDDTPVARLGDEIISMRDVQPDIAFPVYRQSIEIYTLMTGAIDNLIERRLLEREATRLGRTPEQLVIDAESAAAPAADADIDAYLREAPEAAGEPNVRERIGYYLSERARIRARADYIDTLRKQAGYVLLLDPPSPPRIDLTAKDAPTRGPANAPVTLVHFAAFDSQASARSAALIQNLLAEFPNRILWAHRSFPRGHDELGLAAVQLAAVARQHGKFWQVHDRFFEKHGTLTVQDLESIAAEAGVPPVGVGELTAIEDVKRDIEVARDIGIESDPAVFVNGRYYNPAFSYDRLRSMVAEELKNSPAAPAGR